MQVASYLLAEGFLSKCLSALAEELNPDNCLSYLSLAQEICCNELKMTVFIYLSKNLLELPQLIRYSIGLMQHSYPLSVLDYMAMFNLTFTAQHIPS